MASADAFEILALVLALAAALLVRPWRLLQPLHASTLLTPLLAVLALLPWLWSWTALAALPIPLHWSTAPLLVLGWPLAVPALCLAGLATLVTANASFGQALTLVVWSGILPATLAFGEASWTCVVAAVLVAWRPQWLATWSDAVYLTAPPATAGKAGRPGRGMS